MSCSGAALLRLQSSQLPPNLRMLRFSQSLRGLHGMPRVECCRGASPRADTTRGDAMCSQLNAGASQPTVRKLAVKRSPEPWRSTYRAGGTLLPDFAVLRPCESGGWWLLLNRRIRRRQSSSPACCVSGVPVSVQQTQCLSRVEAKGSFLTQACWERCPWTAGQWIPARTVRSKVSIAAVHFCQFSCPRPRARAKQINLS